MKKSEISKFCIVGIILLVCFACVAFLVESGMTEQIDRGIIRAIYEFRGSHSDLQGVFYWVNRILTEMGYVYVLVPLALLVLLLCKGDVKSCGLGFGTLLTWLINKGVKLIFYRQRPDLIYHMMEESSTSFPSGHAMTSAFFYFFLAYLLSRTKLNKGVKGVLMAVCAVMPFIVAITRINLSVHYPTDVLGGLCFGGAIACFVAVLVEFVYDKGFDGLKTFFNKGAKK